MNKIRLILLKQKNPGFCQSFLTLQGNFPFFRYFLSPALTENTLPPNCRFPVRKLIIQSSTDEITQL